MVGIKEGSGQVGLMLALLLWHWLIKEILAKAPSFLSENVTFIDLPTIVMLLLVLCLKIR